MAFSLIEILMSILIVSLIFVALAPVFTRRMMPRKDYGIVYTYNGPSQLSIQNSCFLASVDFADSDYPETYSYSPDCTEYKFQVPQGVDRVNLTLVAGGGGGGGAAGGFTETSSLSTGAVESNYTKNFISDIVKSVKMIYMTARGKNGSDFSFIPSEVCQYLPDIGNNAPRCAGKGGKSSPAISDFYIPDEYIRGAGFVNTLSVQTPVNTEYEVSNAANAAFLKMSWGDNKPEQTVTYGINYLTDGYQMLCNIGGTQVKSEETNFEQICRIPSSSIIQSIDGAYGTFFKYADQEFPLNQVFQGGAGGKNAHALGNYGSGGEGQSFQVTHCDDPKWFSSNIETCDYSEMLFAALNSDKVGKIGNSSIVIETERPGGAGGGGAGGSAVRIVNFTVVPGQTYTIVVGKGGAGGAAGVASNDPDDGKNGIGGTSTAIYDQGGNLLLMVNGGAPGQGGKVYDGSAYTGKTGLSGRNYKMLISSSNTLFNEIAVDGKVISELQQGNFNTEFKDISGQNIIGFQRRLIKYNEFQNEPYNTLNSRTRNDSDNIDDFSGAVLNKTGGFSGFEIKTVQVSGGQYDGLYYRSLVNNTGAYIGGLGGFNGLGGKAACGGYFMGNFDGRDDDDGSLPGDSDTRQARINTIMLGNNSYKITDFYEGCSTKSPDGATVQFVAPRPHYSEFGSAGSGGGGGGYNILAGSGRGGDGQDGYLMIEWRK